MESSHIREPFVLVESALYGNIMVFERLRVIVTKEQ